MALLSLIPGGFSLPQNPLYMARKPGFTFYPGDYLRDTQNLSAESQTAYDRIMCEHMRNICITQKQLEFFTKRLTPDQKEELAMVLTKVEEGYQIEWVADSIMKYNRFCESRAKNRTGKTKKQVKNTSKSLVPHLEDEIDNEDEDINTGSTNTLLTNGTAKKLPIAPQMVQIHQKHVPGYPVDQGKDFPACLAIAENIANQKGWPLESITNGKQQDVADEWELLSEFASNDSWYGKKSIHFISNNFQDFILAFKKSNNGKTNSGGANGTKPSILGIRSAEDCQL